MLQYRQLKCDNPVIIVNKRCQNDYNNAISYTINGSRTYRTSSNYLAAETAIPKLDRILTNKGYLYSYQGNPITPADLVGFFITLANGEDIPMYLEVPCGKCIHCRKRYVNELSSRVACDIEYYGTPAIMSTLTYNDEHLPSDRLLRIDDVQRFMKRLRIKLKRDGYDSDGMRYLYCGEYGDQRGRPHYHLILWNIPTLEENIESNLLVKRWDDIISATWHQGYTLTKICDGSRNSVQYLTKYCTKASSQDQSVPPFVRWSRGTKTTQGLGAGYIAQYIPFLRRYPTAQLTLRNGNRVIIGRYFREKIFPSYCNLINRDIRKLGHRIGDAIAANNKLFDYVLQLFAHKWSNITNNQLDTFHRLCPSWKKSATPRQAKEEWLGRSTLNCYPLRMYFENAVRQIINYKVDWSYIDNMQQLRAKWLSMLPISCCVDLDIQRYANLLDTQTTSTDNQ